MTVLRALASLRLTFPAMAALLVGVLALHRAGAQSVLWMALPLAVLVANLLAALAVDPRLRRRGGLLVFHLCLLAVLLLALAGQLTGMQGRVEIVQGQGFDAAAVTPVREGPWHARAALERLAFEQGAFRVAYSAAHVRGATESRVRVAGQEVAFGDNVPLVLDGYRFYTTSNKGYAAVLTWRGEGGGRLQGAVHFPSYPLHEWKQINRWTTPAGEVLHLELLLPPPPSRGTAWALGPQVPAAALRLRAGDNVLRLEPGQAARLAGGTLRFDALRLWMGYEIYFDPLLSWLLAAALVGVAALGWHFRDKLAPRPAGAGVGRRAAPEGGGARSAGA